MATKKRNVPHKEYTRYTVGIPEKQNSHLERVREYMGFNTMSDTIRYLMNRGLSIEMQSMALQASSQMPEALRDLGQVMRELEKEVQL